MKMPPGGEAQANNSDPILSALAGSHWDACSENSLAVDGLDAIPYETLEASGIPRDVAEKLKLELWIQRVHCVWLGRSPDKYTLFLTC